MSERKLGANFKTFFPTYQNFLAQNENFRQIVEICAREFCHRNKLSNFPTSYYPEQKFAAMRSFAESFTKSGRNLFFEGSLCSRKFSLVDNFHSRKFCDEKFIRAEDFTLDSLWKFLSFESLQSRESLRGRFYSWEKFVLCVRKILDL